MTAQYDKSSLNDDARAIDLPGYYFDPSSLDAACYEARALGGHVVYSEDRELRIEVAL